MAITSYEYDILSQRLSKTEYLIQCLSKQITDCCGETITPPTPTCDDVSITTQPQGGTVTAGNNLTLSVVAIGNPTITYQWKKGGVDITGATSASYSIVNANSGSIGTYTVLITNPCGSLLSSGASVGVVTPPQTALIYWGWTDSSTITNLSQIISLQNSASYPSGQDISASFMANSSPKYLVMAEPATEPLKTKWYGSPQNNGNIGTSNDLFPAPTTISTFRVYITAYQTQQTQTPIVFKIS